MGKYDVWVEYRSKSSKTLVVRVKGTATWYDWVEIDSIKKEPKSEGNNETLNILIPEATKIMETILSFIKTIKVGINANEQNRSIKTN